MDQEKPLQLIHWRKDTSFSIISKDRRFLIITGDKNPPAICLLYNKNRRVRGEWKDLIGAKKHAEKIALKELKLAEVNS